MSLKAATVYEPGYVIAGKYELEAVLGQGGMGAVWRARNVDLDSLVAIKVLRAPVGHAALRTTRDHAALRGRLIQEARAAAKLTHPAIVKVFDVGQTQSGDPFIVMELLHGSSLGTILAAENRLPSIQAVRILLPIADALSLAHSKNIVHRDLKPDNVFVTHDAGSIQPKLVDFGIVKVQQDDAESHLTAAGAVLGSPDYMSPEQARGEDDIDLTTDVWSLSVVLYEAIAGRCPFMGANYNALLRQIVEETPPTLEELAAADADLSAIVMRGLSKQRKDRFASMGELGRALAIWLISQGVYEDICGTNLEPRWLRDTDPHGRPVGRASLASLTDAWPLESGSGIRANAAGVNTLPVSPHPSQVEGAPITPAEPAVSRRRKWPIAVVALVMGGAGFAAVSMRDRGPALAPSSAASLAPVSPAARAPAQTAEEGKAAAVSASAPSVATAPETAASVGSNKVSAQAGRPKVSSPKGRKPAPRKAGPAPAATPTPKKGGAKPGTDLISPYQ
ncbi:MAG TPA: protein kinase [Polyangiaceae bacterium]|nr:protein kinase [Polyangiaceae bacterium]